MVTTSLCEVNVVVYRTELTEIMSLFSHIKKSTFLILVIVNSIAV